MVVVVPVVVRVLVSPTAVRVAPVLNVQHVEVRHVVVPQLIVLHLHQLHLPQAQALQQALEPGEVQPLARAVAPEQLRDVELLLLLLRDALMWVGGALRAAVGVVVLMVVVLVRIVRLVTAVALGEQEGHEAQEAELGLKLDQHRLHKLQVLSVHSCSSSSPFFCFCPSDLSLALFKPGSDF